jgi:glutamate-5-semialdehyde dehydrogenase
LLVHEVVAEEFLPRVVDHLANAGVTFRAGPISASLLKHAGVQTAVPDDFDTEWLSLVLGLKVVPDLESALTHIHQHSTHHSDGILTGNQANADRFVNEIDSAAVYVNASTRFTDGGQFGLGAEVAVSSRTEQESSPRVFVS